MVRARKAVLAFASLALLPLLLSSCAREKVYLTAQNDRGDLTAKLLWKEHALMPGGDCILVVTNAANAVLLKTTLLENRDDFEDMKAEFTGVSIAAKVVHLEVKRNHYKGPTEIEVP